MRTSWTQPSGGTAAFIHEARVIDFNLVTWTVDVRTQFDQKFYPNVQVASPYMHANRGEGIYAMPEVNAKCLVCIPSDGPPPFILCFIMPMETPEDPEGDDAAENAADTAGANQGAVFSGGRLRGKPGDIVLRGRDGNFVILHRGGVLQIGSTELAQRIYIPLGNIVTDISQNYEHHNTGGSINWGLSTSFTDNNPETEYRQTFRLHANDEKADIRVAIGKVHQPVTEPPEGEGSTNAGLNIGTGDNTICVELVVAPAAFVAESGAPNNETPKASKVRLFFDKNGGGFFRAEANVNVRVKKKLRISVEDLDVVASKSAQITADGALRLLGKKGVQITSGEGPTVINGGDTPVAAVGSAVSVLITAPIPITVMLPVGPTPGMILVGGQLTGFVTNGSSTVLVPAPG